MYYSSFHSRTIRHRLGLFVGILALETLAAAQGTTKSPPPAAAPKPAAAKPAAAKPKPAPAATTTATPAATAKAAPAGGTLEAKGFSRVEVTPAYKEEFQKEVRVAVVVAPSYRNSGLNQLRYTYVDALEMKAEFERQGYKVWLVAPSEATADNVRKALQDSKQLIEGTNQATFVFAFSGHGFQTAKGNYLVTVGVTPEQVEAEGLSLEDVQKLMNESGARRKIILVDACRNDPDAKSTETPRTFSQFQAAEGTSILLSTRPGGFSYEDSDLGHGIFTYYVLEALRGKAAGKDGFVTFFDLQKYVENGVVTQALKKERVQRPFVMGERSGDFLLATAAPPKPDAVPVIPAASQNINSNSQVLREIGGGGRSFFALLDGPKLTLIDSKTLAPYVELMDTAANDLTPGYRHFRGNGPNRDILEAGVEMKGEDIVGLKGRIGLPCANANVPCSAPAQVPPLPGEKVSQARTNTGTVAGAANAARTGLSRLGLGRSAKQANTAAVGAETTNAALDSNNQLLKFQWKSFDLTSNLVKK